MSNLSSNDSSTFGNTACQNSSRPKFQPIRVKALLHFCESDDDESEDKPRNTDSESDSESEPQHLPNDEFSKQVLYKMSSCNKDPKLLLDLKVENQELQVAQGALNTNKVLREQITGINHIKGCNSQASEATIIANIESNMSNDIYDNVKSSENKELWLSNNYQINVEGIYKNEVSKHIKSSITANIDYNKRTRASTCQELPLNMQIENLNVHPPNDKTSLQTSKNTEISNENGKENFNCDHDHHLNRLATETSVQKEDCEISDQCNFSRNEDTKCGSMALAVYNSESYMHVESHNSHLHNSQTESVELEAFTNKESLLCENTDVGLVLHTADNLVVNTPLKNVITGLHPNPCLSRKKLVQTPQNELHKNLSACSGQTSATTLSHWVHNNVCQTPLQCKSLNKKDFMQTPKNVTYTPNVTKRETPRYFGMENKTVRRPLADTTSLTQNSNSIFPLESKSRIVNISHLPKVDSTRLEIKSDLYKNKNSDYNMDKKKLDDLERNYAHTDLIQTDQLKENKHPDTLQALENNETFDKVLENRKSFVNANALADVNKDSQKQCNRDLNSDPTKIHKESQAHHPVTSDSNQQLDMKYVMGTLSNVQFSLPSNISKLTDSKMLLVKGKEYLILGTLGQGMSGEVVRVQDMSSLELRAIKCVNLSRMDKDSAQGCLEEISMLHKLQAPCVIKMFDYEINYPMVYVVMEMGDTDLSRLLKAMLNEKQLPLTMILYYWTEMLTAVKHIHDNGVIHSDLKPANFLLVRGRLKLIDFGIASSINADMTSVVKNCPIGTLNYISPEALMDISGTGDSPTHNVKYKISFKSDVWSLGCILYSLVYGHTPFHHIRSQWAKVNAITNPKPNIAYPISISTTDDKNQCYRPPLILIDVMKKCLQHDPKMRPTVTQLLQLEYVPTKPDVALTLSSDVPDNVLIKIKHALTKEEWRHLIQALERRRYT